MFPQPVSRGVQGAFIVRPFTKYKDFHEAARGHIASGWHKHAVESASNFLAVRSNPECSVICQLDTKVKQTIEENRKKLIPIISSIIFCATHDIALRGKNVNSGNLHDLLQFRVEAGDIDLGNHLKNAAQNAKYTSVRTQNELIHLCEETIREEIVDTANSKVGFSIIADETADIAGKEQLSIGVRFIDGQGDNNELTIREEFLGFTSLDQMSAAAIADAILAQVNKYGLNPENLVGQGYDGCSTMAGKEGGVQAIIRAKYPKAAFVHCASHRLNLVVHDLNSVSLVRNTIGTIKSIITFFRDSPKRRKLLPTIPLLCETRWTEKYKSIRRFFENFDLIHQSLDELSTLGTGNTRQTAHQLLTASSTTGFLVTLVIIAKYSALLEPITQAFQAVCIDILAVKNQIKNVLAILNVHRSEASENFSGIFGEVCSLAEKLGLELSLNLPRRRSVPADNIKEHFRRSVYIPYLDSLIQSLTTRFSSENEGHYDLLSLHPLQLKNLGDNQFRAVVESISHTHDFDNFRAEATLWREMWCHDSDAPVAKSDLSKISMIELVKYASLLPAVSQAIQVAATIPATSCSAERSFSTLRRVKTWLRSTMCDDRLSGLCMMSLHRKKIEQNTPKFIEKVINKFAQDHRRIQFAFGTD